MIKILILQFKQDPDLDALALEYAMSIMEDNKTSTQHILVDEPFSILCAAGISMELQDYDGVIVLGALVQYEKPHCTILYKELLRCFSDLAMHYSMPIGLGIVLAENQFEALKTTEKRSKDAAMSCIELIKMKNQLGLFENEALTRYSN